MAILLIIGDDATSVEQTVKSDVLYTTCHAKLSDAEDDLRKKQYDFLVQVYDPIKTNREDSFGKVKALQPDIKAIWLVQENDAKCYQDDGRFYDDDFIIEPVTRDKMLKAIGGDLINQSKVDELFSKKD